MSSLARRVSNITPSSSPLAHREPIPATPQHEHEPRDDKKETNLVYLGSLSLLIVGIRHTTGTAYPGEHVQLTREPKNPYDANAIRIDNMDGDKVGYMKSTMAMGLAPVMDRFRNVIEIDGIIPSLESSNSIYSIPVNVDLYGRDDCEDSANLFHSVSELLISRGLHFDSSTEMVDIPTFSPKEAKIASPVLERRSDSKMPPRTRSVLEILGKETNSLISKLDMKSKEAYNLQDVNALIKEQKEYIKSLSKSLGELLNILIRDAYTYKIVTEAKSLQLPSPFSEQTFPESGDSEDESNTTLTTKMSDKAESIFSSPSLVARSGKRTVASAATGDFAFRNGPEILFETTPKSPGIKKKGALTRKSGEKAEPILSRTGSIRNEKKTAMSSPVRSKQKSSISAGHSTPRAFARERGGNAEQPSTPCSASKSEKTTITSSPARPKLIPRTETESFKTKDTLERKSVGNTEMPMSSSLSRRVKKATITTPVRHTLKSRAAASHATSRNEAKKLVVTPSKSSNNRSSTASTTPTSK